jgi:hypothetical protein
MVHICLVIFTKMVIIRSHHHFDEECARMGCKFPQPVPETSKNLAQIEAFYACADAYDAVERVMIDAAYRIADAGHEAAR